MKTRVIEVPVEFFAQLSGYLKPEERWASKENNGLILWAHPAQALEFVPKPPTEVECAS